MINNGYVAKMLPSQKMCKSIDMKKGPNLRWSLIQCSGGDEGDRTPDLLTASQALSQLSYAPVRRSTIRELPRRCKDNFGQFCGAWNGCGAERTHDARSILSLQKTDRFTTLITGFLTSRLLSHNGQAIYLRFYERRIRCARPPSIQRSKPAWF